VAAESSSGFRLETGNAATDEQDLNPFDSKKSPLLREAFGVNQLNETEDVIGRIAVDRGIDVDRLHRGSRRSDDREARARTL
jgi:hypothetical protein